MIIKNAKFIKSVASAETVCDFNAPEIAVVGRSNVGKSSFINMLGRAKNLAKTSSTPGRTRLINYFEFNNGEFILVDLPGYGYHKATKSEAAKWGELIEGYLANSHNLKHVLFLVDIRHTPSVKDQQMMNYLFFYNIPFTIIATKSDKLSKGAHKKHVSEIAATLKVGQDNIYVVSNRDGYGKDKITERIAQFVENK